MSENSSARQETEFKFRVADAGAFEALLAALGTTAAEWPLVHQVNSFFDTPGLALRTAGIILRLRDEGGRYIATAKGPLAHDARDPLLQSKLEEELLLDESDAAAILAGRSSILAVLSAHCGRARLLARCAELTGTQALELIGRFENDRLCVGPLDIGAPAAVVFEMDRTEFPGGRTDYEVEVEIPGGDERAYRDCLTALFERASVRWTASSSKAKRFFELLPG